MAVGVSDDIFPSLAPHCAGVAHSLFVVGIFFLALILAFGTLGAAINWFESPATQSIEKSAFIARSVFFAILFGISYAQQRSKLLRQQDLNKQTNPTT